MCACVRACAGVAVLTLCRPTTSLWDEGSLAAAVSGAFMFGEKLPGQRYLSGKSFEEWVLRFRDMAAPLRCTNYVLEPSVVHVQSTHAVLRISTSLVDVYISVGTNYHGGGETDRDRRVLQDLDFWQMSVRLEGLRIGDVSLSGTLGRTARPVLGDKGKAVMSGPSAIRGTCRRLQGVWRSGSRLCSRKGILGVVPYSTFRVVDERADSDYPPSFMCTYRWYVTA